MMNQQYMKIAIEEAKRASELAEIPIGAVVVHQDQIIACTSNSCEQDLNPLQHAEIKAIQVAALHKGNWRLNDCDLYVTMEPCPMCLGACFQARIGKLYFGCHDTKRPRAVSQPVGNSDNPRETSCPSMFPSLFGQVELTDNNHKLSISGGILKEECSQLLKDFFKKKRSSKESV